ncbi:hypothetical protein SPD48_14525 [Pseudogracilibacillus sp. SE30717A]
MKFKNKATGLDKTISKKLDPSGKGLEFFHDCPECGNKVKAYYW